VNNLIVPKILIVFGTRPEVIKLIPVINELKGRKKIDLYVCNTSQHREMVQELIADYSIKVDYDLDIMTKSQTLSQITYRVMQGISDILDSIKPDFVIVHGDTTTAFAAALASFYLEKRVLHVEAGLRTFNLQSPFPEEFNRTAISFLSFHHFAPTNNAKDNLVLQGVKDSFITVTGNTVIDLLHESYSPNYSDSNLHWIGKSRFFLITAHRRENRQYMEKMFLGIRKVLIDFPSVKAVFPVHKNPVVRELAHKIFEGLENILLIEPLSVKSFHNIMARAYFVVSDSGGIQEEAPSFQVPVALMRENTERPEGIGNGVILVGVKENDIYSGLSKLLEDSMYYSSVKPINNPFGDGNSANRIVDVIEKLITSP
jgi:UDP-N-acetylglucosamine 2-epimerase (non-hydrolysing)